MPLINRALTALKRIFIVIGIAFAFSVGLVGAIVLSLHSSQTTVPNIVGKDRADAENAISEAGLNFRVRATRPASEAKPDTVLIQVPASGEVVKVGQTVAVDLSRPAKEGEAPAANTEDAKKPENSNERASSANNTNEEKPKRPRNTNKNGNDNSNNSNANGNRNRNGNTGSNSNRSNSNTNHPGDHNLSPTGTPANTVSSSNNRRNGANNRSNNNSNGNRRRPAVSPTP